MVGIGFAFIENILYLAAAYDGTDGMGPGGTEALTWTFVVRCLASPFAHPLFTAFTGIGVGIAVASRSSVGADAGAGRRVRPGRARARGLERLHPVRRPGLRRRLPRGDGAGLPGPRRLRRVEPHQRAADAHGGAVRRGRPRPDPGHRHRLGRRPRSAPSRSHLGPRAGRRRGRAGDARLPASGDRARFPASSIPTRHTPARLRGARPALSSLGSPPPGPTSPSPDRWYPPDERHRRRPRPAGRRPGGHADAHRVGQAARRTAARPAAPDRARRRRAAPGAVGDDRPARGLRHPAADDDRRADADGGGRLDRCRQVHAGQLPRRHPGHRARRAASDHPVAGARAPPRRRPLVRPGPAAARPGAGLPLDQRPGRAAAGALGRGPPGAVGSRRTRHRLGRGAQPHPGRPAAGRGRPVALRHLCREVRRPGAVGLPAQRRRAQRRGGHRARPHPRGGGGDGLRPPRADAREPRPEGLADVHRARGRGERRGAAPGGPRRRHPRLAGVARRRQHRPRGGGQADARRRDPVAGLAHPQRGRRRGRAVRGRPTAARGRRQGLRPGGRGRGHRLGRRHAAARRGARPLAGVRRHRRAAAVARDPHRGAARPRRQLPQGAPGSRPSG